MRHQRLSYGTAGTAVQPPPRAPAAAPRQAPLARVEAGLAAPVPYGRAPAQTRQRRLVVVGLVVLHAAAIVALMSAGRLREEIIEGRPLFLATIAAPARVQPSRPLPLPPPSAKLHLPPPLALPLLAPEPSPSPSPLVAQAVPSAPPAPSDEASTAPVPTAAPVPLPRLIPASGVHYIVAPAPVYSRVSAKMRESGKAVVRVYIDEAGLPRNVQLALSTGFSRLDDSALAAVRAARFHPYLENGVAIAGWATIPIEFELPT